MERLGHRQSLSSPRVSTKEGQRKLQESISAVALTSSRNTLALNLSKVGETLEVRAAIVGYIAAEEQVCSICLLGVFDLNTLAKCPCF